MVQEIIDEGMLKHNLKTKLANVRPYQQRIVPMGPPVTSATDRQRLVENNARRLEVLRNCVNFIFDNKISDARINDSSMDENGVAYNILPLATAFCRKLCTGVIQFSYTCIQDHAVWGSLSFWEQSFYQDVQKQIRQLYLPQYEEHLVTEKAKEGSKSVVSPKENGDTSNAWSRLSSTNSESRKSGSVALKPREIGALEIAAEQLRVWPTVSKTQQEEFENNEESTVFSQAIHYANRMVYMRVPLDASRSPRATSHYDGENSSTVTAASIGESDSYDAESGFDETETADVASTVTRFVTRFVDKVCTEGGVTPDHIKSLHQMVPGVIAMHLETLEAVNRESKRLPPIQKPKILTPILLPGEEIVMEGLRSYLLQDGREEGLGGTLGGPSLIPAEGAIFLTTYRIIFKGMPCDPFVCEQVVMRCFPVSTLTKEKKISVQYMPHLDQYLQEGLQLRANVFQLMKVAFDEEVGSENVETLRKLMHKVRNPPSIFSTFAFTGHASQQVTPLIKNKEKNASLRHFAKRTLLKTAKKAGFRPKQSQRKQKYVLPTPPLTRRNASPRSSDSESDRPSSEVFDDLSNVYLVGFYVVPLVEVVDETDLIVPSLSSDPKNIERLIERPSYQDYERLGLAIQHCWQCRSLSVMKVYESLPGVIDSTGASSGEASSSIEQEKYFLLLVAATPISNRNTYTAQCSDSLTSLDSLMMVGLALNRIGSLRDKGRLSPNLERPRQNGSLDPRGDMINNSVRGLQRVALYILGEKNQMKNVKVDAFPKCDFIPVDFYEVRHIKASFKKLMRACVPSRPPTNSEQGFLKAIEESEWLPQLQNVLQLAGAVVDLLDVQGASVMVCLEDGWDITTQVVCTAEVMLDPYYRTIEGFKALVEKEWLAFGHRFTHRSNQTAANQASGFAPVFLQFLDIVHQIHRQFPLSFEFNLYFLEFLAYHYVSNRFRTFMLDNEFERVEAGWLLEERRSGGVTVEEVSEGQGFSPKHGPSAGTGSAASLWDYIDKHHRKSAIFQNFLYSPHDQEPVLRPYSNISSLEVWDYYLTEDLAHGPSYDVELAESELRQNTDMLPDSAAATADGRRVIINSCYDNITLQQPDYFRHQFREIQRLESELGHLPQKWKIQWDKLECPPGREAVHRQPSYSTQIVRSHGRSIHKRSTLEILVRGKMLGEAARMFSHPHRFERHTYTTPTYCDFCQQLLWGFSKTGTHCVDCGYNCHEKCQPMVPKTCTKLKAVTDTSASTISVTRPGGGDATISSSSSGPAFENFSSSHGEHRTHEGYLYKQGAFFKGWKQRWFVLDSMKHQMRYYDAMEDSHCKGYIDLAEVESVQPVKTMPGAPKKAEENSFIEQAAVKVQAG
nr:hypothetical protein BaRGS_022359 [Batillaria attramentaria]